MEIISRKLNLMNQTEDLRRKLQHVKSMLVSLPVYVNYKQPVKTHVTGRMPSSCQVSSGFDYFRIRSSAIPHKLPRQCHAENSDKTPRKPRSGCQPCRNEIQPMRRRPQTVWQSRRPSILDVMIQGRLRLHRLALARTSH